MLKILLGSILVVALVGIGFMGSFYTSEPNICKPGELDDAKTIGSAVGAATAFHISQTGGETQINLVVLDMGPAKKFVIPSEEGQDIASFVVKLGDKSYLSICPRTCFCETTPYTGINISGNSD